MSWADIAAKNGESLSVLTALAKGEQNESGNGRGIPSRDWPGETTYLLALDHPFPFSLTLFPLPPFTSSPLLLYSQLPLNPNNPSLLKTF